MGIASKDYFEYRIIEFKDNSGEVRTYLCQLKKNGENFGAHFEAKDMESVFCWLRLMIGAYPGTGFNDDNETGAVA